MQRSRLSGAAADSIRDAAVARRNPCLACRRRPRRASVSDKRQKKSFVYSALLVTPVFVSLQSDE
jgi:hypothetical protein